MRRFFVFLALVLILAVPASAYSGVSSAENATVVSSDGSCIVTVTLSLQLDTVPTGLTYPLPGKAADVTVNGTEVRTSYSGGIRRADLSGIITAPGSYSLTIRYRLADAIDADKDGSLTLNLQLLTGFDYPIDSMSFRITLPGPVSSRPSFTSTYYQQSIETMMELSQEGSVITGVIDTRLQDHESLSMTLAVTEDMFPQTVAKKWSMDTMDLWMIGIAVLAVAYWIIFMRCLPPRKLRRTVPPDGITAGEITCRLTGQGADFTMMVLSWAQMGYLLIQPDDDGRVLLHKRMDMGNERDDFEIKWFRKLFGKRSIVDGTGYFYAQLCRKVAKLTPGCQNQYQRGSGNPRLLRILAAAAGSVSGVSLAAAFAADTGWKAVLSVLLGIGGFLVSWLIQGAARSLHSRSRGPLAAGICVAAAWLLLSYAAGEWNVALILIPCQFLAGLGALYGGRRTETGRTNAGEILGLRQYLKTMPPEEVKRNMHIDPNYYYDLAPYAMALGVDRAFARQFGRIRLPQCPYLTTGMDGHLTAQEWNQLLRDTVAALDAMQRRLPIDRLLGR